MRRIIAGLFAICAGTAVVASCSFDSSGTPASADPDPDAALTTPDAGTFDAAATPPLPPDACMGKKCDGGPKGPGDG